MGNHQKTMSDFRNYLAVIGYGKSTLQMIPTCVNEFLEFTEVVNLKKIVSQDIISFHEYLQTRPNKRKHGGLSEMMIIHEMYALKLFFNYLLYTEQICKNPMSNLFFRKNHPNERITLEIDEVKSLFDVAGTMEEVAILHLFYSCGLRRNEAVKLNYSDVHFREKLLYVREGKGSKSRVIPITQKVADDFKNYFYIEREKVTNIKRNSTGFILNSSGRRMQGDTFYKRFKKLLSAAKITKNVSLHHLRHSIATHLLENGMGFEYVKDFLGHKNLESTQIYTHVNNHLIENL